MKKIWKQRSEEGVSPVIATILMVAITVVLAAVLYVMVIGLVDDDGKRTPTGALVVDVRDASEVLITFGLFEPEPKPLDIKVRITNNSDLTDVIELSFTGAPGAVTVDMVATQGATATYTDMNFNGNQINSGDYIVMDGLNPQTSYKIDIYYSPSQSLCQIAGDTDFNMP